MCAKPCCRARGKESWTNIVEVIYLVAVLVLADNFGTGKIYMYASRANGEEQVEHWHMHQRSCSSFWAHQNFSSWTKPPERAHISHTLSLNKEKAF